MTQLELSVICKNELPQLQSAMRPAGWHPIAIPKEDLQIGDIPVAIPGVCCTGPLSGSPSASAAARAPCTSTRRTPASTSDGSTP